MNYFDDINALKYIYLGELGEPEDNSLRIIIEEAITEPTMQSAAVGNIGIGKSHEILVTEKSSVYEVIFSSYIGYSVIDESFALPNDQEVFEGRVFCVYKKSDYLDYLKKSSFACDDHPGPFKHYGFNCLNHVINIASIDEPSITLLATGRGVTTVTNSRGGVVTVIDKGPRFEP